MADANKWRIKKDARFGNKWVVFAPGYALRASYVGVSFRQCVYVMPMLMRIDANWKRLNGGRVRHGS